MENLKGKLTSIIAFNSWNNIVYKLFLEQDHAPSQVFQTTEDVTAGL